MAHVESRADKANLSFRELAHYRVRAEKNVCAQLDHDTLLNGKVAMGNCLVFAEHPTTHRISVGGQDFDSPRQNKQGNESPSVGGTRDKCEKS